MQSDLVEIAVTMRKQNLTIKEISEKINKSESTVKRWLLPYGLKVSSENQKVNALKASLKMQENYALKRVEAYNKAKATVAVDLEDTLLRDFVNIYIGEGYKRNRDSVSIVNSDPKIILLSLYVMKKYFLKSDKKMIMQIRYYKENDNELELLEYWQNLANNENVKFTTYIQPTVKAEGHNNSNKYGLVTVTINDTYAKQKLNAYMDYVKEEWTKNFEQEFNTKFVEKV